MKNQRGFTLPELLVAILFFALLLAASMYLLRVQKHDVAQRNAERRLEIAALSRGTAKYIAAKGGLPDVPSKATPIGSYEGQYDLCGITVPAYSLDMPLDPLHGAKVTYDEDDTPVPSTKRCNVEGVEYTTGYTIRKNDKGQIVLGVQKPEGPALTFTMR